MSQQRTARLNPDTMPVLIVAVLLAAGLAAVSFALSFAGLVGVSSWAHVPHRLIWAVPVMLDSAIVVYTLAILVKRARHERAVGAWATLALWTAVSVAANAAHAAGVPDTWQRAVGTVVAALAPIAVLLATHTIADLIVARTDAAASAGEDEVSAEWDAARETDTDSPSGTAATSGPSVVRRHPTPRPRGRAAEHRDEIVRLAAEGLSVRAIAERVEVGKSAVAELLRREVAGGAVTA
ncbi:MULTISPECIES: DUF2637 domain-containing protein [unclassified Isoptericola]|uniref:DUF2637 domain-containing protein n=1 Tax=unclassified Isoptericola TaxID=2623355 RepID=UPI00364C66CD